MTTEPTNIEMVCALSKLSMDEREALFDHYVRHETYDSIAVRLGVTRAGVGVMIQRAKKKLAKELADGC